jgi:hypothetical protein
MLSTKWGGRQRACATAEFAREKTQRIDGVFEQTSISYRRSHGAIPMTEAEEVAVLDVAVLAQIGGGWGELDPSG